MTMDEKLSMTQALQWRTAFDQSFAQAPCDATVDLHDYLAIRAGEGSYALRLGEVAGLQMLNSLTPCPSRRTELLGLSTFRGNVLPVYDLRVLLGAASSAAQQAPAWWIAVKDEPLGLAFDVFERHLRLPGEAVARASTADARLYTGQTLRSDGQLRPIVSIDSILLSIKEMVRAAA
jgi:chemotaxis signal transduction protein